MRLTLRVGHNDDELESFRPAKRLAWEMVTSGEWSESPFHGGRIVYEIAQASPGTWLLQSCEWSDEEADWDDPTDYHRIVAVLESAPTELTIAGAARHLYEAWSATKVAKAISETYLDGLLDEPTVAPLAEVGSLYDLPDVPARRQAVADDLAKDGRDFADIDGQELAQLLDVTPGEASDRIHLCAIDEDETAQWLQEELSQGEGDGSLLLEKVLSATRQKSLRRYLTKVEEGEDVDEFPLTPRELKKLAPLRAQKRLEEGEIDKAWSYDEAVAPDGTKLIFTFAIGEDGEVEGCLATPYDGRLEPDPKEYAWE
jgi:hypothetical protein